MIYFTLHFYCHRSAFFYEPDDFPSPILSCKLFFLTGVCFLKQTADAVSCETLQGKPYQTFVHGKHFPNNQADLLISSAIILTGGCISFSFWLLNIVENKS